MVSLAILIPNFNGEKFIGNAVRSFALGFPESKVLVIDDGSTDGSLSILSATSAEIIIRKKNGGFAATINTGLRSLLNAGYSHILVANSDVMVGEADCINIRNKFFKISNNKKIGVLGFVEAGSRRIPEGSDISGFMFILSAEVIKSIGYFDESFYMYGEEQDYFLRVLESNFTIEQTKIEIRHAIEGSAKSKIKNSWYAIRNALYLQAKRAKFLEFIRTLVVLFLIINRIKFNVDKSDPSYQRVARAGVFIGNYFLVNAIIWSLYKMIFKSPNDR